LKILRCINFTSSPLTYIGEIPIPETIKKNRLIYLKYNAGFRG